MSACRKGRAFPHCAAAKPPCLLRLNRTHIHWVLFSPLRFGAPRSFTVLAIVDALMLVGATAFAGLFAHKRKIALHRKWARLNHRWAVMRSPQSFVAGRFV